MPSVEEHAKELEIRSVFIALVISSFGFVMALFWRDAIQELIGQVIPSGEGLPYRFAAAAVVTVISALAIYLISKYLGVKREGK